MLHLLVTNTWYIGGAGKLTYDGVPIMFNRLLAGGLDINATNEAGETPIFAFFREGTVRLRDWKNRLSRFREEYIYDFFTQHGADWQAINAKGQSLLHVVANRLSTVSSSSCTDDEPSDACNRFKALLDRGLDVGLEDKDSRTPLDAAANAAQIDILDLFVRTGHS